MKKLEEIADYVGKNYGYNIEFSSEKKYEEEEMVFIYKKLYEKYGIYNLKLYSNYCKTCFSHDKKRPYHFDAERILDLEKEEVLKTLNRKVWSDKDIEKEIQKIKEIKEKIKGVEKEEKADEKRKLYEFYNELRRTIEGMNRKFNYLLVNKEFYDEIMSVEDVEAKEYIKKWEARIDVREDLEAEYKLYEM